MWWSRTGWATVQTMTGQGWSSTTAMERSYGDMAARTPRLSRSSSSTASVGKVFIVNPNGKVEWEYATGQCNDLWALPNGNLLFNTGHGVREVTRQKAVVFNYESSSEIYACQRLTNGNTFVGECNAGRLLELAPDGKVVKDIHLLPPGKDGGHLYMRNARQLANGGHR